MNIVYLIGNGFDLNLGMETKFEHFCKYLLNLNDNDPPYINDLKNTINKNMTYWSKFEFALGEFLEELQEDEAVKLHDYLIEHLSIYLASEESKFNFDEEQKRSFWESFKNPFSKDSILLPAETWELEEYRRNIEKKNELQRKNTSQNIKVITFNYTRTIEKISDNFIEIEHIHGWTDNRMILGVNDTAQIANEKFRQNLDVTNRYIKSDCNNTYGTLHVGKCEEWITDANLICLFGLSFGDTDKRWWEKVGDTLIRGHSKIIIFEHNKEKQFNGNQGPAKKAAKEAVKDEFLSKANIEINSSFRDHIYIAYNTDMFKPASQVLQV